MLGNLLHLSVVLQKAAGDVERHVRAVDDALEQQQKFRDDLLDVVGDKDLVAVELDLAGDDLQLVLLLREVEDALEVKRIVDVEVDPEQRLVKIHKDLVVKFLVLLVGAVLRGLQPQRMGVVDRARLDNLLLFGAVLVLFGVALLVIDGALLVVRVEVDFVRHELAVLVQNLVDARLLQKFLLVLGDVHDDGGAVFGAVAVLNLVLLLAGRNPVNWLCALLVGEGLNLHRAGNHEGRIKSQAKVADDAGVALALLLVFFQKFLRAGEGDLGDVPLHLVLGHADAVIRDDQLLFIRVDGDDDLGLIALLVRRLADAAQALQLFDGVAAVGDNLP